MLRYLKAAWRVRPRVPFLGAVPINPVLASAFVIFGVVVNPAFILLGAGLLGAFNVALASSKRFQNLVDATDSLSRTTFVQEKKSELVGQLDGEAKAQLRSFEGRCERIRQLYRSQQADDFAQRTNSEALDKLQWVYLKLLIARQRLIEHDESTSERSIQREIDQIRRELESADVTPTMRESRGATLELLEKRQESARRRVQSLRELDSDLRRIDAQVDLALDEATLRGTPTAISPNIELASQLLDAGAFGASSQTIIDLDQAFESERSGGRR
jgi:hypothetical protein